MKTRIAPTPSGFLHVGNAVSFLITYCLAKSENGKLLLRIDDLDRERYRKEYVDDIFNLDAYSPYMLVTTQVKPEWRNKIPAVTHIDYTARYQSVTRNNNQKYYDLIYTLNT